MIASTRRRAVGNPPLNFNSVLHLLVGANGISIRMVALCSPPNNSIPRPPINLADGSG